jgi:hypothetical protein
VRQAEPAKAFPQNPTQGIIAFEVFIFAITAAILYWSYKNDKKTILKYGVIVLGVFIFEFFTQPLWHNYNMSCWSYAYRDVDWVLTMGWSTLLFSSLKIAGCIAKESKALAKFGYALMIGSIAGLIAESGVITLGIRSYAPEALERISGIDLPFLRTPIEALYYIPIFMILVMSFYKYCELTFIENTGLLPMKKQAWGRNLLISLIGVFLYEMLVEPMVVNVGFPKWSYIYQDISVLMTVSWVVLIWISIGIVDRALVMKTNRLEKFLSYLFIITILTIPLESWAISSGMRVYSTSLTENFSGYMIPFTQLAVEAAFAIPLFLALVIGFIKYWSYVFDNKL